MFILVQNRFKMLMSERANGKTADIVSHVTCATGAV